MKTRLKRLPVAVAAGIGACSGSVTAASTAYFDHAAFTGGAGPVTMVGFDNVGSGLAFGKERYADVDLTIVHRDRRGQMTGIDMTVLTFAPAAASISRVSDRQLRSG
jgi:hypothetical protein